MSRQYKRTNAFLIVSLPIILLFLSSGCSKEEADNDKNELKGTIGFSVSGIIDEEGEEVFTRSQMKQQVKVKSINEDFELIALLSSQKNITTRATSPLPNGVYYRVIAYKKTGTNYTYFDHIDNSAGSSGENNILELDAGFSYKFVAYSYNQETLITDVTDTDNDNITPPEHADLLYWSSTDVYISDGENTNIEITFSHKLARLEVQVISVNGYTMESPDIELPDLKKANSMKLETGIILNTEDITLSSFNIEGSEKAYTRTAYPDYNSSDPDRLETYTNFKAVGITYIYPQTYNSLSLTVNSLSLVSGGNITNQTSDFKIFTPIAGHSYKLEVHIRKKINQEWSQGFLTKKELTSNPVFEEWSNNSPANKNSGGFYWMWGLKNDKTSIDSYTEDPCAEPGQPEAGPSLEGQYVQWNTNESWGLNTDFLDPCTKANSEYKLPIKSDFKDLIALGGYFDATKEGAYFGTIIPPTQATESLYPFFPAGGNTNWPLYNSVDPSNMESRGYYWSNNSGNYTTTGVGMVFTKNQISLPSYSRVYIKSLIRCIKQSI
ncbi:fimbrillin family protein [Massilibacteroides sp.]|uniref:fimbrillin family protein n=1 Tax=Massilibacteroides sp. TaxID=2034766 RepID=UPI00260D82E8|nr:fimbrillin family protein [Massilibacteroides sp.]MDD4514774.1 fimbrillin family protein [Massilibacteroides sp.]